MILNASSCRLHFLTVKSIIKIVENLIRFLSFSQVVNKVFSGQNQVGLPGDNFFILVKNSF
jgi:hypothetical protein